MVLLTTIRCSLPGLFTVCSMSSQPPSSEASSRRSSKVSGCSTFAPSASSPSPPGKAITLSSGYSSANLPSASPTCSSGVVPQGGLTGRVSSLWGSSSPAPSERVPSCPTSPYPIPGTIARLLPPLAH
eukprot:TRINITY_DN15916_c0_g2_i1.p1 TRINITY_DN15916_c0_g2~~TRINITY_DN15916_c0_g2_i1.p1  ORF type:complete len:128 (-),score=23.55 TRINITY_DN15916_c0_g2_i1:157-540(-)